MTTKTYTLLVTITDRAQFDPQALADRICAQLENGDRDWSPVESVVVDALEGDRLRGDPSADHVQRLHREAREDGSRAPGHSGGAR